MPAENLNSDRNQNEIDLIEEKTILSSLLFGSIHYKELKPEPQELFFTIAEHKAIFSWIIKQDSSTLDTLKLEYYLLNEYGYDKPYCDNLIVALHIAYFTSQIAPSLDYLNNIVVNLATKRQGTQFLTKVAESISGTSLQDPQSISKTIKEIQNTSSILIDSWYKQKDFFMGPEKAFEKIDQWLESIKIQPVATPFQELNKLTNGGFKPSELVIVGARPSIGKTTFACNLCLHFALRELKENQQIIFWTLEDSIERIQMKQLNMFLRDNFLKPKNSYTEGNIVKARETLSKLPIKYAQDHVCIEDFCVRVKRLHNKLPCKIIIIDYSNKIFSNVNRNTRAEDVGTIASALRDLAKSCDSLIILLAQINRNSEGRAIRLPQLQDLKESGSLEESADIVLLLHREYPFLLANPPQTSDMSKIKDYKDNLVREKNKARLFVAKNKFNETGPVDLYFYGEDIGFIDQQKV